MSTVESKRDPRAPPAPAAPLKPILTTEEILAPLKTIPETPRLVSGVPANLFSRPKPQPQQLVSLPRTGIERCAEAVGKARDIDGSVCLTNIMFDFGRRIVYGLPQVMYGGTFAVEVACWNVLREGGAHIGGLAVPLDGFSRTAGYYLRKHFDVLREESRESTTEQSSLAGVTIGDTCLPLDPQAIRQELRYRNENSFHEPTFNGQTTIDAFERLLKAINPSVLPGAEASQNQGRVQEASREIRGLATYFTDELKSKRAVSTSALNSRSLLEYVIPDETEPEIQWLLAADETNADILRSIEGTAKPMDWEKLKQTSVVKDPDWIERFERSTAERDAEIELQEVKLSAAETLADKDIKEMQIDFGGLGIGGGSGAGAGAADEGKSESKRQGPIPRYNRDEYPEAIYDRLVNGQAVVERKRGLGAAVKDQKEKLGHYALDQLQDEIDKLDLEKLELERQYKIVMGRVDQKQKTKIKERAEERKAAQKEAVRLFKEESKAREKKAKQDDLEEKDKEAEKKHEKRMKELKDSQKQALLDQAERLKDLQRKKVSAKERKREEDELREEKRRTDEEFKRNVKRANKDLEETKENLRKEEVERKKRDFADGLKRKSGELDAEAKKKQDRIITEYERKERLRAWKAELKQIEDEQKKARKKGAEAVVKKVKRDFALRQIQQLKEKLDGALQALAEASRPERKDAPNRSGGRRGETKEREEKKRPPGRGQESERKEGDDEGPPGERGAGGDSDEIVDLRHEERVAAALDELRQEFEPDIDLDVDIDED